MMSRERDLLKKVDHWYSNEFPEGDLYTSIKEIRKLLAQPEKEPEPEAWMLIDKETGARIPKAYLPINGVNKERWELYPLYAKQKPLSDDTDRAEQARGIRGVDDE